MVICFFDISLDLARKEWDLNLEAAQFLDQSIFQGSKGYWRPPICEKGDHQAAWMNG